MDRRHARVRLHVFKVGRLRLRTTALHKKVPWAFLSRVLPPSTELVQRPPDDADQQPPLPTLFPIPTIPSTAVHLSPSTCVQSTVSQPPPRLNHLPVPDLRLPSTARIRISCCTCHSSLLCPIRSALLSNCLESCVQPAERWPVPSF